MNWNTEFSSAADAEEYAAFCHRLERQAAIRAQGQQRRMEWADTRTPQEAAGDHYERMMEVPGWAEAQPF